MAQEELAQVGRRLRAARKATGMTLHELAGRAEISASTISRLESGKRQASLELLIPLVRQLGISIDELLVKPTQDPRVRRRVIRNDGIIMAPLTSEGSSVQTFHVTYPPSKRAPQPKTHDGYEWLYVLSGRLRLVLGERELILTHGEAAEFDTREPHSMSAAGTRPAKIISIFNAEGARLHAVTNSH